MGGAVFTENSGEEPAGRLLKRFCCRPSTTTKTPRERDWLRLQWRLTDGCRPRGERRLSQSFIWQRILLTSFTESSQLTTESSPGSEGDSRTATEAVVGTSAPPTSIVTVIRSTSGW